LRTFQHASPFLIHWLARRLLLLLLLLLLLTGGQGPPIALPSEAPAVRALPASQQFLSAPDARCSHVRLRLYV